MLELYQNIKKRREELGMSQEQLAKLVGYTNRSTIARIERGDIDLPQSMIVKFAEALRVTPAYLMGWIDEEGNEIQDDSVPAAEARQQLAERPGLKALLDAGAKLSDEDVKNIIKIMESMSNK